MVSLTADQHLRDSASSGIETPADLGVVAMGSSRDGSNFDVEAFPGYGGRACGSILTGGGFEPGWCGWRSLATRSYRSTSRDSFDGGARQYFQARPASVPTGRRRTCRAVPVWLKGGGGGGGVCVLIVLLRPIFMTQKVSTRQA